MLSIQFKWLKEKNALVSSCIRFSVQIFFWKWVLTSANCLSAIHCITGTSKTNLCPPYTQHWNGGVSVTTGGTRWRTQKAPLWEAEEGPLTSSMHSRPSQGVPRSEEAPLSGRESSHCGSCFGILPISAAPNEGRFPCSSTWEMLG